VSDLHYLAGAANACRYGKINEPDHMPPAYDDGRQNSSMRTTFPPASAPLC